MNFKTRRRVLGALLAAPWIFKAHAAESNVIRIGISPVFLGDQVLLLDALHDYLNQRLQMPAQFFRPGSYAVAVNMLMQNQLDFAWIGGYAYALNRRHLNLVVTPQYQNEPRCRSCIIVGAHLPQIKRLADLKGGTFAYDDPLSDSGFLIPRAEILDLKENPDTFFRRSFFARAQHKVADAVSVGLADGGAVADYLWGTLVKKQPKIAEKARVIWRSKPYAFPPIVARRNLADRQVQMFRSVLLRMNTDVAGRHLLGQFDLNGFVHANDGLYDETAQLHQRVMPIK